MEAERGSDRLGRHLALLQREERLLELRHHLALAHEAEIAAARRRGRILGNLLRELAEVRARFRSPDGVGDLGARLVLARAAAGLRDAGQHVGGADLARRLVFVEMLLVELLDVGVGDLRRVIFWIQGHILDSPPIGLAELVGMLGEIDGELIVGGVGAGHDRPQLDQGPRGTHFLAPELEGLLELALRHLDAAPDRGLDLGARQLTADLTLERRSSVAAPLEDVLVALEHEAPGFLEERDRVDTRVQLLVADRESLRGRPLHDQRLLDEIAEDLLRQPQPLGHLGREAVTVDLRVGLQV